VFRYGIDLNRWLEENGYLVLKKDGRGKKNLAGVDWSQTKAFAIGLSGLYLNLKGRESKGIVDPKSEAPALRQEIIEKLESYVDPIHNQSVVKKAYNAWKIYKGPFKNDAPDILVGYEVGYRASWETAVGQVTDSVVHDNLKAWSGDHCIDQSLVPGVLFCNRGIEDEHPRLMDIGPTVLDMFGVKVPGNMDGKPLNILLGASGAGGSVEAANVQGAR
jgi:predicted AlkP superfamily phosphohydrolase/phosphomutase